MQKTCHPQAEFYLNAVGARKQIHTAFSKAGGREDQWKNPNIDTQLKKKLLPADKFKKI